MVRPSVQRLSKRIAVNLVLWSILKSAAEQTLPVVDPLTGADLLDTS